ncbi:MAG: large subunit ribosomal protein L21e [Candidatus Woesearchaeota archaeon]|jgi:large subunit ribosomal protein L21e
MATRTGGARRKTRHKFQVSIREKGKISIRRYLQSFETGERVLLKAQPSIHKALYFRRFHSLSGIITGKQGSCYKVAINDQNKKKIVLTHPAHLVKQ